MKRMPHVIVSLTSLFIMTAAPAIAGKQQAMIGVNAVLKVPITKTVLANLGKYGAVRAVIPAINAVMLQTSESKLESIRGLSYVAAAGPDAERTGAPVDTVSAENFADGFSTWNLDSVNVTNFGFNNRQVDADGTGVYVAVLDTGLVDTWRQYFPEERIAQQYAKAFIGGGESDAGKIAEPPNVWEHDQNSHGTHVTSTILGYSFFGFPINGVAPMATVIPVKVLNQNGSGRASVIAQGITYVADLKEKKLAGNPVIINMSLGGPVLDAVEKAAIDYAIAKGVIIVASAGNNGPHGMGYPAAYAPVISVGASGFTGQWTHGGWWLSNIPEPTAPADFYIADFSSRAHNGQDLDVVAPGSWVVGPYKTNSGNSLSYYYLGGTSMAAPHVTGIAALMMQKNPFLNQSYVESILEFTAIPLAAGCRSVLSPWGPDPDDVCWGTDATGAGLVTADAALAAVP